MCIRDRTSGINLAMLNSGLGMGNLKKNSLLARNSMLARPSRNVPVVDRIDEVEEEPLGMEMSQEQGKGKQLAQENQNLLRQDNFLKVQNWVQGESRKEEENTKSNEEHAKEEEERKRKEREERRRQLELEMLKELEGI
eukprot:TRINITY_DN7771_c0_g1_i1.p1 TRINITY_DN7771_c0_g1~~TRINITY_DN7771_c0_g1_i1.p1  ORF type:complete len:139 (+),score=44.58 TRINITY_DN7771_c0_g1_i1:64-480(+)